MVPGGSGCCKGFPVRYIWSYYGRWHVFLAYNLACLRCVDL